MDPDCWIMENLILENGHHENGIENEVGGDEVGSDFHHDSLVQKLCSVITVLETELLHQSQQLGNMSFGNGHYTTGNHSTTEDFDCRVTIEVQNISFSNFSQLPSIIGGILNKNSRQLELDPLSVTIREYAVSFILENGSKMEIRFALADAHFAPTFI